MRARSDDLTPAELALLDDVEANGVHLVSVPEDGDHPGYTYSVGMWESFGQPEVVVFGLPAEVAEGLLDAVADEADEGVQFLDGSRHAGLLQDYPVRCFAVPKAFHRDFLGLACWAYEGADFEAVQIVWPDKQGRWPWEDGVREVFRGCQPVLAKLEPPA